MPHLELGSTAVKDDRMKKDEYQKALVAYSEAMKEFHKGRFEKAGELLRAFSEKHPAEREFVDRAKMYLAICTERLKETREMPTPKTFEDYRHFGVYKMNMGEFEEAQKLFDKAANLKPEDGMVHFLKADVYIRMDKPEEALEALKKALLADKSLKILAQNEADFEPLWEDKRFKLLTRMA
jgi:tetratricopeptide (TPR) repeat protein